MPLDIVWPKNFSRDCPYRKLDLVSYKNPKLVVGRKLAQFLIDALATTFRPEHFTPSIKTGLPYRLAQTFQVGKLRKPKELAAGQTVRYALVRLFRDSNN
jgi:hypothetical protein